MWEEELLGQEMCLLRYIGIFEDGKEDFVVFFIRKLWENLILCFISKNKF